MTRAFYTMPAPHRTAFRAALASVRDSHPGTTAVEQAFLALDVDRPAIERTHTLELHARVAERLALTPEADREAIEAALFGGETSMTRRLTDVEFLEALDDLFVESVLAMTPEELREEILAEGGDPDAMAEEARQAGLRAIRQSEATRAAAECELRAWQADGEEEDASAPLQPRQLRPREA